MADNDIPVADTSSYASLSLEQALQELTHMPITEACVSGLCEICVAQQRCLCGLSAEEATSVQAFKQ